jgi:hypothetical protein
MIRSIVVVALVVGVLAVIALRASKETESAQPASDNARARSNGAGTASLPNPWIAAKAADNPNAAGLSDFCGYGKVDLEALPVELDEATDAFILRQARAAQRSPDDGRKAVGLAIDALISGNIAERGAIGARAALCRATPLCDAQSVEAFNGGAAGPLQAAIQLALGTSDPKAYAVALRLCASIDLDATPPGCGALTVDTWAQRDPDNALPWILAAREAFRRNDPSAIDYALQRAGQAKFFDRRRARYGELLAGPMPGLLAERTLVVAKLTIAEDLWEPLDFSSKFVFFKRYCEDASDLARRDVCKSIRNTLALHSSDHLADELVQALPPPPGESTGAALASPRSYSNLAHSRTVSDLTCAALEWNEAWLRGVAKGGERAYGLQLAKAEAALRSTSSPRP